MLGLLYDVAYRIGLTPWDTGTTPSELVDLVEGPDPLPKGRAVLGIDASKHEAGGEGGPDDPPATPRPALPAVRRVIQ